MDALLAALEATAPAEMLRTGRWSYAAVNGGHILGIALLVGAIVPLDLKLLGLWRNVPRAALARVLVPTAATGLALAATCGLLLFSVRATTYAGMGLVQAKLALVAVGTLAALSLHRGHGLALENASPARLRVHALLSIACWAGALACGRLIGFAM